MSLGLWNLGIRQFNHHVQFCFMMSWTERYTRKIDRQTTVLTILACTD